MHPTPYHELNLNFNMLHCGVWRRLLGEDSQKIITVVQHQQEAYSSYKLAPLKATRFDWITLNVTSTSFVQSHLVLNQKIFWLAVFPGKEKEKKLPISVSIWVMLDLDPNRKLRALTTFLLVVFLSLLSMKSFAHKDMWNKRRSSGKHSNRVNLASAPVSPQQLWASPPLFAFCIYFPCLHLPLWADDGVLFSFSSSLTPKITQHVNDQPLRGNNGTFVVPGPVGVERWTKRANMCVSSQLAPPLTVTLLLLLLGIQGEIPHGRTSPFFCLMMCPAVWCWH